MHPAPTRPPHTKPMQQHSVTITRAAHWRRRLCTTTVGAAHGGVTQQPCRALHVVSQGSREPCGSPPIMASTEVELRRHPAARARSERSVQPHASRCAHVRRAHRMAAKRSVVRRPSTLLRHRHAARCQCWQLVQSPQRTVAAAACESSGAGATWWTAADMDGRTRGSRLFTVVTWPLL